MPVVVCLLRGVNVGGRGRLPMEQWRGLLEELGGQAVRTYVQSGNAVLRVASAAGLAERIESQIEQRFGFRPRAVLRTEAELRAVVRGNPHAGEGLPGDKLTVTFYPDGRNEYRYFPEGIGQSKIRPDKEGTMRNWNTVEALLAMAAETAKARG
jgi:uncharacterized protein (DUF1697 family)